MKYRLKKYEKYLDIFHYLELLRKQPKHMQHVYALSISGCVTAIIAAGILYFDYGFWQDTYKREEKLEVITKELEDPKLNTFSPREMMGSFFREAGERIKAIQLHNPSLLEGKEDYLQEEKEASLSQ